LPTFFNQFNHGSQTGLVLADAPKVIANKPKLFIVITSTPIGFCKRHVIHGKGLVGSLIAFNLFNVHACDGSARFAVGGGGFFFSKNFPGGGGGGAGWHVAQSALGSDQSPTLQFCDFRVCLVRNRKQCLQTARGTI